MAKKVITLAQIKEAVLSDFSRDAALSAKTIAKAKKVEDLDEFAYLMSGKTLSLIDKFEEQEEK